MKKKQTKAHVSNRQIRRYDIDWLRNLALLLLIFYHIGMYYVYEWEWHIKSDTQSAALQNIMVFSSIWRMNLLFFVSGISIALIKNKYSMRDLAKTRFMRLFLPLIFGMCFIVPVQVYYEFSAQGVFEQYEDIEHYGVFLLSYLNINTDLAIERQSIIGLYTWNHLWYLLYLFVYTVVFMAVAPQVNKLTQTTVFKHIRAVPFFLVFSVYLLVVWVYIRPKFPTTHALIDDWWSHVKYFPIMLFGYLFAHRLDIWNTIIERRRIFVYVGLACYAFIVLDRNEAFPFMGEAFQNYALVQFAYGSVVIGDMWCWILACIGYVGRYLNQPSALLNYANEAVLPWYILHQSLIILFAANLSLFEFHPAIEAMGILTLTLVSCYLSFALIRRVKALRLVFGLRV
ncbi:acyltransferase family protein [Agaribacter flavus]|uniref:Acyltransferase family protein n=1 Tax=Agaribacter flavus TaxID=1902781 RepID=A0ABV7FIS6_9ALTE